MDAGRVQLMAQSSIQIVLRLVHDGVPPTPQPGEVLVFGTQDKSGVFEPGTVAKGRGYVFDYAVAARLDEATGSPVFSGRYCQGSPAERFIFLNWKRGPDKPTLWAFRLKIPLAQITWDDVIAATSGDQVLQSIVTGRKPTLTKPASWDVVPRA